MYGVCESDTALPGFYHSGEGYGTACSTQELLPYSFKQAG